MDTPGHPPDRPTITVDGYDLLTTIGHGGFSVVYRARQHSMNREVAIKVLNTGFANDAERRLFVRECHALGQLSHHPNIVTVFNDAMTSDGRPCIVMELYRSNYRDQVERLGPLPVEAVLAMATRVCGALQTAHDAGVLHRDIKPHNIFMSAYDEPALGDFGISTIDDERSQSRFSALSVAYASPEILDDAGASVSSDLYALGATIYQLLTGDAPFRSPELSATLRRIVTEPPPVVDRAGVSAGLNALIAELLAKEPTGRPTSAFEVGQRVREIQRDAGFELTPVPLMRADVDPPDLPPPALQPPRPPSEPPARATAASPRGVVPPPPPSTGSRATTHVPVDATVAREGQVSTPGPPPDTGRSRSRWGWVVAGAAVLVALAVGGILALSADDGDGDDGGAEEQTDDADGAGAIDEAPPGVEGEAADADGAEATTPEKTLADPKVGTAGLMPPRYDYRIDFEMPPDAVTMVVIARPADGEPEDAEPETERAKKSPVVIGFDDVRRICVRMRALDGDGNELAKTAGETCGGVD